MNGRPGDHPLTDILIHKRPTFSAEIDRLIIEIVALGGEKELKKQFDLFNPPPLNVFQQKLQTLRDDLKNQAKDRGWET